MKFQSVYQGQTATRTSAKPYRFAVWCRLDERARAFGFPVEAKPVAFRWTTRRDLAEREAKLLQSWGYMSDVAVVEVTIV
jgi:hypothetical protein